MVTERDLELLDDYLTNRLSDQEKSAFKQKLETNSDLAHEYKIQQRLIQGVKDIRIAELKTMLNNVPVPPVHPGATAGLTKAAIGTFLAGVIATGAYLYFNQPTESETAVQQLTTNEDQQPIQSHDQQEQPAQDAPVQTEHQEDENNTHIANNKSEEIKSLENKPKHQQEAPKRKPSLDVFVPSEDTESVNVPVPDEKIALSDKEEKKGPSITVEIDKQNRKYNFHYQFKDNKLFLYGPFEKNLYEIMEFFSEDKRTVFLYHKDEYYLLSEDNNKIKPLTAITDPALIQKLKESRGN